MNTRFSSELLDGESPGSTAVLHGTILETHGPIAVLPPANWWKRGTILLAVAAFLPLVIIIWLVLFLVRVTFSMAGIGPANGGLWGSIVFFHAVGTLFRPVVPIPVYHHVLRGTSGRFAVRQEGVLRQGCIFAGNIVQLECERRRGDLVVRRGYNKTLSTAIATPGNPWKVLFFVLLAAAISVYGAMLT